MRMSFHFSIAAGRWDVCIILISLYFVCNYAAAAVAGDEFKRIASPPPAGQ